MGCFHFRTQFGQKVQLFLVFGIWLGSGLISLLSHSSAFSQAPHQYKSFAFVLGRRNGGAKHHPASLLAVRTSVNTRSGARCVNTQSWNKIVRYNILRRNWNNFCAVAEGHPTMEHCCGNTAVRSTAQLLRNCTVLAPPFRRKRWKHSKK